MWKKWKESYTCYLDNVKDVLDMEKYREKLIILESWMLSIMMIHGRRRKHHVCLYYKVQFFSHSLQFSSRTNVVKLAEVWHGEPMMARDKLSKASRWEDMVGCGSSKILLLFSISKTITLVN